MLEAAVTALWDTTGADVMTALRAERRNAGGVTSGLALTLVVVVDERDVQEAESAAALAGEQHPCRLLIVVRRNVLATDSRLDAEIVVGGRLGPCEAVVMRMHGRLALHAESVVLPLLAPDVPVVTWWYGAPPERIAYDPLGVVADRRITDCTRAEDPLAALTTRAADYAPGDTDLAWTRITPWRALLAGALDTASAKARGARIAASESDPSAQLLAGWLRARLDVSPMFSGTGARQITDVELSLADDSLTTIARHNGTASLRRTGYTDRTLPLLTRPLGEELAEELRRLDADQSYAAALGAATGTVGLDARPTRREHIWHDPAVAERPEPPPDHRAAAATAAVREVPPP